MTVNLPKPLVSVEWLAKNLDNPNIVVLNATIKKVTDKDSISINEIKQIKNALFFDIKNLFSDTSSNLPNTFPSAKQFQEEVRKLGINNDTLIVVYDVYGFYSCARAWWLFKSFGHKKVSVLNGGLPVWKAQNLPVEIQSYFKGELGNFKARYLENSVKKYKDVLVKISNPNAVIIDARTANRFSGSVPEPRKGLRSGHIPSSKSLPYSELIIDNKLKSKNELKKIFNNLVNEDQKITFSCGSGITACILALGAEIADYKNVSVYDGSWTEWGSRLELPIEK